MLIAVVILISLGFLSLIFVYNGLIAKKNNIENALGSIDAMLKKRYDLVPNLIDTVKTYMTHEKDILNNLTELRTKAISGNISPTEKNSLDQNIGKAMGNIIVAAENYPDLKASNNFINLQNSLNEIEEQISAARRTYNATVTEYNNALEMFPSSFFADILGYEEKEVFEITEKERKNIDIGQMFK